MSGRAHAYVSIRATKAGFVGLCKCGFETEPEPDRPHALRSVVFHTMTAAIAAATSWDDLIKGVRRPGDAVMPNLRLASVVTTVLHRVEFDPPLRLDGLSVEVTAAVVSVCDGQMQEIPVFLGFGLTRRTLTRYGEEREVVGAVSHEGLIGHLTAGVLDLVAAQIDAAVTTMTARLPHSMFDSFGRCLTVAGVGETIRVQVEGVRDRQRIQSFELDAETAVDVAHDLLERALSRCDCDEVTAAVEALRALALREDGLRVQGETTNGDGR